MRELTKDEIVQVNGAAFNWFTGEGELFSAENIAAATRFSTGLSLLAGSAAVGWEIGSWVNNHYGTQISDAVWSITH